ncbi:MAG: MetQ/NlpA family ABC transporter substrate-binding protein [Muricomes sp.]
MKRKIFKRMLMIAATVVLVSGLAACGAKKETADTKQKDTSKETSSEEAKKHVVIGGTAISEVTYNAIKPHFEELGYTTEFVMFDANPVVLEACNSKEVDMALGQHKKFVESFNQNNQGDLAMAKPYGYYTGIGFYSNKYSSAEEFPDGAQIAIMNDAMNMDIALRILEDAGLIKIDKDVDTATVADITENPKNLKIVDMDQAQTVAALEDMDGACVFFTHMANAGLDPLIYSKRYSDD